MEPLTSILVSVFFCAVCAIFWFDSTKQLKIESKRASKIDPIYEPVAVAEDRLKKTTDQYNALKIQYRNNLKKLSETEEALTLFELGIGTTDNELFELSDPDESLEELQKELTKAKDQIKLLVKSKRACQCEFSKDVAVNNSRAKARTLFNREIRLRIRCLDNEFKMANAMVDWHNVNRLKRRCERAFDEINETGRTVKTFLRKPYLHLKIRELELNYRIENLKALVKERGREERQIKREAEQAEARLKADAEKAKRDREKMERLVEKELSKMQTATKEQLEIIAQHKRQLEELRQREARAVSMAQQTRAGYVYVLSNEMSYGAGVCKIGMTRRLDPNIRVRELGDASVPELFDTHAFAYSEDAPALEKFLHTHFDDKRVNLVNKRKEFFRVDVDTAIAAVKKYDKPIELQTF